MAASQGKVNKSFRLSFGGQTATVVVVDWHWGLIKLFRAWKLFSLKYQ